MDEQRDDSNPASEIAGQHPHVPGHDPLGSGLPRQMDFRLATTPTFDEGDDRPTPPGEDDAPLGGSQNTEDQLTADTDVERDALKSLDPDDTPA